MRGGLLIVFLIVSYVSMGQRTERLPAISRQAWPDSVFLSLTPEQRIAQLLVVRLSAYDSRQKKPVFFDSLVTSMVKKYNIGAICLFQGNPTRQASIINSLQLLAQTPLLVCIDAEWGVGMRMYDSVQALPKQMMLGAVQNPDIVYQYGKLIAHQCRRLGINVNYAPVVDINNNPANPVINDRSFGEDKYKVSQYGLQYIRALQDNDVMACAKHFPGHGDVSVDSHLDLPVIGKTLSELDTLELYPFREAFKNGVSSAMVAHLYVPSIDSTPNRATSLSPKVVKSLLRDSLGFTGLTFTDALEMQGVKKFFPVGESSVESLIAGNDMLCLPGDVDTVIGKIKAAIAEGRLTWDDINEHCCKVLSAKYQYGCSHFSSVALPSLVEDLNKGIREMRQLVAKNALTLLRKDDEIFFPLSICANKPATDIAYVGIGISNDNYFSGKMREEFGADVFYFNYKQEASRIATLIERIKENYGKVVIGIHSVNRSPADNFGISTQAVSLVNQLQQQCKTITFLFGNAYAVKNFCEAKNLVVCYEDDEITQDVAINFLKGNLVAKGKLPVTVCTQYRYGSGIDMPVVKMPLALPDTAGFDTKKLSYIDTIATQAIRAKATPGCIVLVAREGTIVYHKAFGTMDYADKQTLGKDAVFDLASVTKICATTLAVMKLYEEKKLDINKDIGAYLPSARGSNKERIKIVDLLLHQAGLVPFIPFYKETLDEKGNPSTQFYRKAPDESFSIPVAEDMYMLKGWKDTMFKRILASPLLYSDKYVYSDNDFIFLGRIVEAVSGQTLDNYVAEKFYIPMGLTSTTFNPYTTFPAACVVPTENDTVFRKKLLRGYVNDPGAAMMGGVAGHAGLFSNATDLAALLQMLLNNGIYNNRQYLKPSTIQYFTRYASSVSRRGLGFDKPEKDNISRKEPYPSLFASASAFGHTGYTGTCVWADPDKQLVYIFLSNRLMDNGGDNTRLVHMNIRGKIMDAIYKAIIH